MKEDSFGTAKRLYFIRDKVSELLERKSPIVILDVGCGTGQMLSIPLAEIFRDKIHLFAFDTDKNSLSRLNELCDMSGNLDITTLNNRNDLDKRQYDMIIISEVIEHVQKPEIFLKGFVEKTAPEGRIIVTLPNGYGGFELINGCLKILEYFKIITLLRKIKRRLLKRKGKYEPKDTLADSPHINFFTYSGIKRLFHSTGLKADCYEGRTFLCGSAISRFIDKFDFLIRLNSRLGSICHPILVSGWMFVLSLSKDHADGSSG